MSTFLPANIPTQAIALTGTSTVIPLSDTSQPCMLLTVDCDEIVFARWAGATMDPASADIPLPPGSFGTQRRGSATHIAVKTKTGKLGTLYITYGTEV